MREHEPENRPDASSGRSDDQGHRRELQQTAPLVLQLSVVVFVVHD
jgi:hypothetical protein